MDDKVVELRSLLEEAKPKKPRAPRAKKPAQPASAGGNGAKKPAQPASAGGNVIQFSGGSVSAQNIIAGDVHNHTTIQPKAPSRPRVVVVPGEGVVTEAQKAEISALRTDWVTLHATLKKTPLSDASAWSKINRKAGVTSYHLIPADRFEVVKKFIKQEMAKLRAMRSAPSKDDDWRRTRISAIKARSKNQLRDADAYRPYIKKNFGLDSLADLSTEQLRRTHTYIMGKEPPPEEEEPELPE